MHTRHGAKYVAVSLRTLRRMRALLDAGKGLVAVGKKITNS